MPEGFNFKRGQRLLECDACALESLADRVRTADERRPGNHGENPEPRQNPRPVHCAGVRGYIQLVCHFAPLVTVILEARRDDLCFESGNRMCLGCCAHHRVDLCSPFVCQAIVGRRFIKQVIHANCGRPEQCCTTLPRKLQDLVLGNLTNPGPKPLAAF